MSEKEIPTIPLTPVSNSSTVTGRGYDPNTQTLAVEFKSGAVYHYNNVPPETANDFAIAADAADISTGVWLGQNIKGHFSYERVA